MNTPVLLLIKILLICVTLNLPFLLDLPHAYLISGTLCHYFVNRISNKIIHFLNFFCFLSFIVFPLSFIVFPEIVKPPRGKTNTTEVFNNFYFAHWVQYSESMSQYFQELRGVTSRTSLLRVNCRKDECAYNTYRV